MFKIKETEIGDIIVEREVIETIAGLAAIYCYCLWAWLPRIFSLDYGVSWAWTLSVKV